jgi:hypothetical protein
VHIAQVIHALLLLRCYLHTPGVLLGLVCRGLRNLVILLGQVLDAEFEIVGQARGLGRELGELGLGLLLSLLID